MENPRRLTEQEWTAELTRLQKLVDNAAKEKKCQDRTLPERIECGRRMKLLLEAVRQHKLNYYQLVEGAEPVTEPSVLAVVVPAKAPEFAEEESYTAAMRVARIQEAMKAWHVADESEGDATEPDQLAVVCMLADLRHYCDAFKLDFGCLDSEGYHDYVDQLTRDQEAIAARQDPTSDEQSHSATVYASCNLSQSKEHR